MPAEKEHSIEAITIRQMIQELTELRKKVSGMEELSKELSRAQNLLEEAENRLFYIVENVPDIIYVLDSYGNIRYINNSIIRYGYSPEELIGTNILSLVHPDDHERAIYRINERRTGKRSTRLLELRLVKRNRIAVQMEINERPISEPLVFSVSAEGRYERSGAEGPMFTGTIGVARDLSLRGEYPTPGEGKIPLETINNLFKDSSSEKPHHHLLIRDDDYVSICSSCRSIRDGDSWKSVEEYFNIQYNAKFTHTICPVCMNTLYKDLDMAQKA